MLFLLATDNPSFVNVQTREKQKSSSKGLENVQTEAEVHRLVWIRIRKPTPFRHFQN